MLQKSGKPRKNVSKCGDEKLPFGQQNEIKPIWTEIKTVLQAMSNFIM